MFLHRRAAVACLPLVGLALLCAAIAHSSEPSAPAEPAVTVDFDREVRPILADNCFACHGPDEQARKGKLRLDTQEGAFAKKGVITPGSAAKSRLLERILSTDDGEHMPPPKTGKRLTTAQVETLRRWIDGGAKWSQHWSFVKPRRPTLPAVKNRNWRRNGVDDFVLARLETAGLAPSEEADRATLIRRVTLDLTGLPPTLTELEAALNDPSTDWYERLVDRLLQSPRHGERMALDWLDAARFADTHGYHIDAGRDMTRWREWVIDAYNANMPFDQFTVEQIAGDLLPNATVEQKVASGFHRNHMINFEGGAIPEEYHTAYIIDRINTTSTVWLGLTLQCCQCHDHKYDPFTQKEYYQLFAFFHNVPENGLDGSKGNAAPFLKTPTPRQKARLDQIADAMRSLEAKLGGPEDRDLQAQLMKLREEKTRVERDVRNTMVMQEMPAPRDTFLLLRGQYDKKGEKVRAATPARLPPLPKDAPPNRLGLARWLVSADHPLTARVAVNRYWQAYFGTGLVKTAEDFGTQGERPSHPELLDWLACEFQAHWDVKAIQRLIVTSATYRQSAKVTPALLHSDPENRLLARQSRIRLPAEFIRDQALSVSGLLDGEIGGKSVSPYQPAGIWEELAFRADFRNWTAQTYVQDHGKDLYRRAMYTFWKRTVPPPTLVTFDAPDRETCTVRRARTNTPLQALILMNDPTYVEAARKLAERLLTDGGATTDERIRFAFRIVLSRAPTEREIAVVRKIYEDALAKYRKDGEAARKLLNVGEAARNEKLDTAELAAWTMAASVLLNLDEAVTRG